MDQLRSNWRAFFSSWFKYAEARVQIYAGCDMNFIHNLFFLIILSLVCSENMTFYLTSYWMTCYKLLHACIEIGIPPIGVFVRLYIFSFVEIRIILVLNYSYHDFLSSSWIKLTFLANFYISYKNCIRNNKYSKSTH